MPVEIPGGVTVTVAGSRVSAKGPQGELGLDLPAGITAAVEGATIRVSRKTDDRDGRRLHGISRTLLLNLVLGVAKGYSKELLIEGVGFKAAVQGQKLSLALGFASPVQFEIPAGIKVKDEAGTKLVISGPDKQQVGDVAARIRSYFPAEPYKGKGIKYSDEQVRRKVGKTVA